MQLQVSDPWFSALQAGTKAVEGRLNRGKFSTIIPGTLLTISHATDSSAPKLFFVVGSIAHYTSFEEYLDNEGLDKTLPNITTIKDGVAIYRKFYSKEDEVAYGVLAIRLSSQLEVGTN